MEQERKNKQVMLMDLPIMVHSKVPLNFRLKVSFQTTTPLDGVFFNQKMNFSLTNEKNKNFQRIQAPIKSEKRTKRKKHTMNGI